MDIDLRGILEDFLNPQEEPLIKRIIKSKEDRLIDLKKRHQKGLSIKDLLKTPAWRDTLRPTILKSLKTGFGILLRDGLTMSESDIKSTIADMRAHLSIISQMRYEVENGDEAGKKIAKYET